MPKTLLPGLLVASLVGCGASPSTDPTGTNTAGSLTTPPPDVKTVFTIVFENENASSVLTQAAPFFDSLQQQYGVATNYTSSTHPSLPNYITMTSGSTQGITTDNDPTANVPVLGHDHVAAQLDDKQVMWRAYMESMGDPCKMTSTSLYSAHHDPFLYYDEIQKNPASCNQHVVDFDANFASDLASNVYRYLWITPNMCDDMHNCSLQTSDAWLQKVVTQIQQSDAYKDKGAIFILFDEGASRAPGASAALATLVISPQLASVHTISTAFDHRSYLATVEDIFGLGRLPTTTGVTSMGAFFVSVPTAAPSGP